MKKFFVLQAGLLLCHVFGLSNSLTLVPTFENCSFYFQYGDDFSPSVQQSWKTSDVFKLSFREEGAGQWQEAFYPVHDSDRREFRGSLLGLTENTSYSVKAEIFQNGQWTVAAESEFHTWTSEPPLKVTLKLSNLGSYTANQGLVLNEMRGSADGWIKIVADVPVEAGQTADNGVLIKNCEYLILEGFVVTGGRLNGIKIDESCRNIRIVQADISSWGRIPVDQVYLDDADNYPLSSYKDYDAAYLDENKELIRNDAGINIETTSNDPTREHFNFVVERCFIHDPNGYCNPWYGTRTLGTGAGTSYRFLHPQGPQGIYIRSSGGLVIRYNDIVGSQLHRLHDLSGGKDNGKLLGGYYRDSDIYGNYFAFAQDDGIELDGGQCNVRFYGNRVEQVYTGISTAANLKGPSYLFRNVIHNLGDSEGGSSAAFKNGGGDTYSLGITFFLNNTVHVDGNGIAGVGYGSDDNRKMFQGFSRNNILYVNESSSYCIYETDPHVNNSFDYDLLANSKKANRVGTISLKSLPGEEHAVKGDPAFVDRDHAVFSLQAGSAAIGAGELLPNFSATCMDMGAFPFAGSSLSPQRPLPVESDKYSLKIHPKGTAEITITAGKIMEEMEFYVTKNADMDWLTLEVGQTHSIGSGDVYTLRLEADTDERPSGVVFVRFANGYSIPVSVYVDPSVPSALTKACGDSPYFAAGKDCIHVQVPTSGMLALYDVSGKKISEYSCVAGSSHIPVSLPNSVYVLSYVSAGSRYVQKIVLK